MNKKNTERLFKKYPDLFKHRDDMMASLMCFGFECGDGWYDLINQLCGDISKWYNTNRGGIPDDFYVVQVKEKFGSLRFYITAAPKEIHDMISVAEQKSYFICEKCGKEGKMFYRDELPWIMTLCDKCLDKHFEERFGRKRNKDEDFISDWQKENKAPFKIIKV